MKIALAGCSGLSSDLPLRRRLGDDYQAVIKVSGDADREQERYPLLQESLEVDLSSLSPQELDRLLVVVNQAIDQACTVGRTPEIGHRDQLRGQPLTEARLTRMGARLRSGRRVPVVDPLRALELGLTGYAANQHDGRVLVVAQGPREACEQLLALLRRRHPRLGGHRGGGPHRTGRAHARFPRTLIPPSGR